MFNVIFKELWNRKKIMLVRGFKNKDECEDGEDGY